VQLLQQIQHILVPDDRLRRLGEWGEAELSDDDV
jgi:hypothetical protein